MSKRATFFLVGLLSIELALGVGLLVGDRGGSSSGGVTPMAPARTETMALPAGRPASGGDMANGLPAAAPSDSLRFALALSESIRIGGGDRGAVVVIGGSPSVAAPAPASTTVVQARVEGERVIPPGDGRSVTQYPGGSASSTATNAGSTPAPSTPTVVISAQPPPTASNVKTSDSNTSDAPPSVSLEAQVRAAVEANWPASEWATAMYVAWRESRYEPWAANGPCLGVWQVNYILHGSVPSDVMGQASQAAALWRKAGWQPWQ